jgi:hypothetical protein
MTSKCEGESPGLRASEIRMKEVFKALGARKMDVNGVPKGRRGTRDIGPRRADAEEE